MTVHETRLGIDIETIPGEEALKSDVWKRYKDKHEKEDEYAALHPAFCQVVSVAFVRDIGGDRTGHVVHGENEVDVIKGIDCYLYMLGGNPILIGHNIKEFDLPILMARFLRHKERIPHVLNIAGLKPWDLRWITDTSDFIKMGNRQISLDALCLLCGVDSPKTDCDGSSVWKLYKDKKFKELAKYNLGDVHAVLDCYEVLRKYLVR